MLLEDSGSFGQRLVPVIAAALFWCSGASGCMGREGLSSQRSRRPRPARQRHQLRAARGTPGSPCPTWRTSQHPFGRASGSRPAQPATLAQPADPRPQPEACSAEAAGWLEVRRYAEVSPGLARRASSLRWRILRPPRRLSTRAAMKNVTPANRSPSTRMKPAAISRPSAAKQMKQVICARRRAKAYVCCSTLLRAVVRGKVGSVMARGSIPSSAASHPCGCEPA